MRAVIALFALICLAAPAAAQTYRVPSDHAGLIRLPEDAATVVVGNPAIADAMLYDARTLFISGRVFGQTNLIALNADGRVIYVTDIAVTQSDSQHVRVFRNSNGYTFSCNPICEAIPQIGDEANRFRDLSEQRRAVSDAAINAAGAGN